MARIGNTSISSLMAGARAAKAKQQSIDDTYHAYDFDSSEQTPEQLAAYNAYLTTRAGQTTDPTKALAIQRKMDSAQASFTQNEIQREGDRVITGESTLRDKYSKVYQLYQQARTAAAQQNLYSQLLSLDKQIQEQDASNVSKAKSAAAEGLSNSKKEVAMRLKINDIAQNAIQKAGTTGKPVQDEQGNVIKGRLVQDPSTKVYHIELDDNAGPINVTSRQAELSKTTQYMQKSQILQSAIDAGLDDDGGYTMTKSNMESSKDYLDATSPQMLKIIGAADGGANPFKAVVDPVTGNRSFARRAVVDYDKNGMPIFERGFTDPGKIDSTGSTPYIGILHTGDKNSPTDAVQYDTTNFDTMNRKTVDPITGKTYYISKKGAGALNGGLMGTIAQTDDDKRSARKVTDAGGNSNINGLFDTATEFWKHPVDAFSHGADLSAAKSLYGGSLGRNAMLASVPGVGLAAAGLGYAQDLLMHRRPVPPSVQKSTAQVMSPNAVAAHLPAVAVRPIGPTPSVAVRPIAPTPSVAVKPLAPTPSVSVKPIGATPSVKVVGPKPAPAPAKTKPWWHFW